MRWPWQRGDGGTGGADEGAADPTARRAGSEGSEGDGRAVAPGPAPAASSEPAARAESRAGWAFLPPLQRTIHAPELTSRPTAFLHDLPTRQGLSLTSGMSHVVDSRAPSGVVADEAGEHVPVQRSADVDLSVLPPAAPPEAPARRGGQGSLQRLAAPPAGVRPVRAVAVDPDPSFVAPVGPLPSVQRSADPSASADASVV